VFLAGNRSQRSMVCFGEAGANPSGVTFEDSFIPLPMLVRLSWKCLSTRNARAYWVRTKTKLFMRVIPDWVECQIRFFWRNWLETKDNEEPSSLLDETIFLSDLSNKIGYLRMYFQLLLFCFHDENGTIFYQKRGSLKAGIFTIL